MAYQFPGLLNESQGKSNVKQKPSSVANTRNKENVEVTYDFTPESLQRSVNKIVENMMKKNLKMIENSNLAKGKTSNFKEPATKANVGVKKGQQQTKSKNYNTAPSLGKSVK